MYTTRKKSQNSAVNNNSSSISCSGGGGGGGNKIVFYCCWKNVNEIEWNSTDMVKATVQWYNIFGSRLITTGRIKWHINTLSVE